MPKKLFIQIQLAAEQYDRCADCPLCGLIPESERKEGKRMKYVCLGVLYPSLQALSSRGIWVRASKRDTKHPLHRPCDTRWAAWMTLKNRQFALRADVFTKYRLPFEQNLQPRINFD